MGTVQASTFGFATPTALPQSGISWGFGPYSFGIPSISPQYGQPFSNPSVYSSGGAQSLQQIVQFLHAVPHQLQQLQIVQLQQLGQLQQFSQVVAGQLQHLQQLIQVAPQSPFGPQQQPYGSAFTGPATSYLM